MSDDSHYTVTDVAAVWAAVAALVDSEQRRVDRADDADWLADLADPTSTHSTCDVPAYRAATRVWAVIPSLWDQATEALTVGTEEGTGSKPLRERSPADLDLMEIRSIIRDTTRMELEKRGVPVAHDAAGRQVPFLAGEIRALASRVIAEPAPDLEWWEYRFRSWARLLSTYLRATEHEPHAIRLRNAPCPLCHTKQVTIEQGGEYVVAPPLVIDFRDGAVRAAECDACGAVWWRGPDLEALALALAGPVTLSDPNERMTG